MASFRFCRQAGGGGVGWVGGRQAGRQAWREGVLSVCGGAEGERQRHQRADPSAVAQAAPAAAAAITTAVNSDPIIFAPAGLACRIVRLKLATKKTRPNGSTFFHTCRQAGAVRRRQHAEAATGSRRPQLQAPQLEKQCGPIGICTCSSPSCHAARRAPQQLRSQREHIPPPQLPPTRPPARPPTHPPTHLELRGALGDVLQAVCRHPRELRPLPPPRAPPLLQVVSILLAENGGCLQGQLQHALAPAGGAGRLAARAAATAACRELLQFTLAQDVPLLLLGL